MRMEYDRKRVNAHSRNNKKKQQGKWKRAKLQRRWMMCNSGVIAKEKKRKSKPIQFKNVRVGIVHIHTHTVQLDECKWFNHLNVGLLRNHSEFHYSIFLSIRRTCEHPTCCEQKMASQWRMCESKMSAYHPLVSWIVEHSTNRLLYYQVFASKAWTSAPVRILTRIAILYQCSTQCSYEPFGSICLYSILWMSTRCNFIFGQGLKTEKGPQRPLVVDRSNNMYYAYGRKEIKTNFHRLYA